MSVCVKDGPPIWASHAFCIIDMQSVKNDHLGLMDKIVSLCKRRGFVYPGSEIYGGVANTWDFGPLGLALKRNIKKLWWQEFVKKEENVFGLGGGIILSPKVWEASGHVENFTDPLVECKNCHTRFRSDQEPFARPGLAKVACPNCGEKGKFTEPKKFSGMFKTYLGATEDSDTIAYLRPETAQAIFINFKNVVDSMHPKLPFGIAQIGKAFRNEITAGNFIFRDIEFEQMELEFFINENDWEKSFDYWLKKLHSWVSLLRISSDKIHEREHEASERSHYSKKTVDIEFDYPFGRKELYGLAYRTDYDLRNHSAKSGIDLSYTNDSGNKFFPHVIEPSLGVERTMLAVLCNSYSEDEKRVVLKLPPKLAPIKVAVFPLSANKDNLVAKAKEIFLRLRSTADLDCWWDDRGNVGKRYYAQDEIGTPWCVTVDYQTLEDDTVTVRDRDTTGQERVKVATLGGYFQKRLE